MHTSPSDFQARYGPWALVAGGSEGLGLAQANALAARGIDLVLVALEDRELGLVAEDLRARHGVKGVGLAADLGTDAGLALTIAAAVEREVGLLVVNAAAAPVGEFLAVSLAVHRTLIALNCRAAMELVLHFGRAMAARGRGGVVLTSSMAGFQGTALVAHYAASKAYLRVLAEGLWAELGPRGVDVLAVCPGPTDTPGYRRQNPVTEGQVLPPQQPAAVAEETLEALGRRPVLIPGRRNRLAGLATALLPRKLRIAAFSSGTRRLLRGARH
jgi:uncharacterized protein